MVNVSTVRRPNWVASLTRSLSHRNYRLFFVGQIISLSGSWITAVASSWLIYRLTDSPFWLGIMSFASMFPSFLLSPLAGVQADRWDRRVVLLWTQLLSMCQSFALAALTLTGHVTYGRVLVLTILQGLVNAYDIAARQAFLPELIEDRRDLPNAIALNSVVFHATRLVGPALGGYIIAISNEGICFLLDGVSYFAVVISLLMITTAGRERAAERKHLAREFAEGASYVFGFSPVRTLLMLTSFVGLAGLPYTVLLPVFAKKIFAGGPDTLGVLMSASGCGAFCGAMVLASRRSIQGLGPLIGACSLAAGLGLMVFALQASLFGAVLLLFIIGASMVMLWAASSTIVQALIEDRLRGRVMSIYSMAFTGMMPLGSLIAGAVANSAGAPLTTAVCGALCAAASLMFIRRLPMLQREMVPILIERGVL